MTEQEVAALIARNQQLEADLARVTQNRDSILREKKELLERRPGLDPEMAARRQQMRDLGVSTGIEGHQTDRVVIPRHCPPDKYRELRAEAERRGVPLTFADDAPGDPTMRNHGRDDASKVKVVETDATYYANQHLQKTVGVAELSRRAAAAGKSLRIFRSIDDLKNDPEAVAKHQRVMDGGDPDALLFEGA